ncbi:carboxymuconolactone decarboxylase family protein [Streptomyces sp. NPDC001500]
MSAVRALAGTWLSPGLFTLFGSPLGSTLLRHFTAAGKAVSGSTLPATTRVLVLLRASRIDGCGFCADMQRRGAAHRAGGGHRRRQRLQPADVIACWPAGDHQPGRFG